MLVVVPHTKTPLTTHIAGHTVRLVDVSDSDDAYWRLLTDLWAAGGGFAIVEHDIVATPEAIDDLAGCGQDWCAQPYLYVHGQTLTGLACTKFAPGILAAVPDLWEQIAPMCDAQHPPRHWCRLDAWSVHVLGAHGWRVHRHGITVEHASPTVSHGCLT
jgi:hypothetical protein